MSNSQLITGRKPVLEALRDLSLPVEKLIVQKSLSGGIVAEVRRLAENRGISIHYRPSGSLDRQAGGINHQGLVLVTGEIRYADVDEMLASVAATYQDVQSRKPMLLILDQIEDPHNFGAILRSAAAAGVDGVIVPSRHMAPVSTATIRASAGMALRVPIARVTNLADVIMQLKERGYWIVGTSGKAEHTIWNMDWNRPLAIVIGSEGKGMRRRVRDSCDYEVSIPLEKGVDSLNASVAAGVVLLVARQGRLSDGC